jgi:transaldolase
MVARAETINPNVELQKLGQSLWYDNLDRRLIESGVLRRMIEEDGVVGLTSNPTIFDKAISSSVSYDAALSRLVRTGKSPVDIYETLAIEDIRSATDLLRPVYERTGGLDGLVSFEVSPHLAYDTEETLSEVRRLWAAVDRPNLMVKVPATQQGIPAVEQLIGEGININITLIFSLGAYRQVAEAYLAGLEKRVESNLPIDHVSSVASFFVSRVDTKVDGQLAAVLDRNDGQGPNPKLESLLGKAAIANCKLAYEIFQNTFGGSRFQRLSKSGARVQRLLWGSTSTKNPNYPDTYYVDGLIGPATVNTVPTETLYAFKDHGTVARTLDTGLDDARQVAEELARAGVDIDEVTAQLLQEGVDQFAQSFDKLIDGIEARAGMIEAVSG